MNFWRFVFKMLSIWLLMMLSIWVLMMLAISLLSNISYANAVNISEACRQRQFSGLCRGKDLRYAYDATTGNCVSFYYSGCAPTENNFLTFEECRRDCMQQLRY